MSNRQPFVGLASDDSGVHHRVTDDQVIDCISDGDARSGTTSAERVANWRLAIDQSAVNNLQVTVQDSLAWSDLLREAEGVEVAKHRRQWRKEGGRQEVRVELVRARRR